MNNSNLPALVVCLDVAVVTIGNDSEDVNYLGFLIEEQLKGLVDNNPGKDYTFVIQRLNRLASRLEPTALLKQLETEIERTLVLDVITPMDDERVRLDFHDQEYKGYSVISLDETEPPETYWNAFRENGFMDRYGTESGEIAMRLENLYMDAELAKLSARHLKK